MRYLTGIPVVHTGVKNMKVLKTTQSGFEGFLRDRSHSARGQGQVFCTSVLLGNAEGDNYEKFAGPYGHGEYSPSVQKTLYDTQVLVLNRVPEIVMPNQHYFTIDMTKMGLNNKDESSFLWTPQGTSQAQCAGNSRQNCEGTDTRSRKTMLL
ncbi:hypothetical protein INR49_019020 [Caranx melampygus]|nr:hypothetical protein INR49_019020 [Caranx melampygus]